MCIAFLYISYIRALKSLEMTDIMLKKEYINGKKDKYCGFNSAFNKEL